MDSVLDLFLGDRVYDENGKLIKRDFGIKNILAIAVVVFLGYSLMGKNLSFPTLSGKKKGKKMKGKKMKGGDLPESLSKAWLKLKGRYERYPAVFICFVAAGLFLSAFVILLILKQTKGLLVGHTEYIFIFLVVSLLFSSAGIGFWTKQVFLSEESEDSTITNPLSTIVEGSN